MGYTIWDRVKCKPAVNRRYVTHHSASKACERLNAKAFAKEAQSDRYYIKEL